MPPTDRFNGSPSHVADIPAMCLQYVGVEPTLVERYDRLTIHVDERVQSRIDKNNAPDYMAKRYAKLMSETAFPAVLVTADGHMVDGNTRGKAHGIRQERWIKAWVLPIAWTTADAASKEKLLLLSLALNSMNGKPLDEIEMAKYAEILIRQGASDEEIVGRTGLTMTKIGSLRDCQRATDRLTQVGINVEFLNLPDTTLRSFGKPAAMRLDDEVYTGLVNLSRDAGLKPTAIAGLASSIGEQTSPDTRRERLARERQILEPQITAIRTGQAVPMQVAWLCKAISNLLDKPVLAFVESDPDKVAEYGDLLMKAIERLQEIAAVQQGVQPPVPAPLGREATH